MQGEFILYMRHEVSWIRTHKTIIKDYLIRIIC